MAKYTQGFFKPKNPQKYKGDPTNIVYRSGWELKLMLWFDREPNVLEWRSEELIIPYRSPIDKRIHRYFPDFLIKKKDPEGKVTTMMIEIKPAKFTRPPAKVNKKPTKTQLNEIFEYGKNQAKWKAAREYCADRKWEFVIMTEKELGIV